jgi:hypothetical protein
MPSDDRRLAITSGSGLHTAFVGWCISSAERAMRARSPVLQNDLEGPELRWKPVEEPSFSLFDTRRKETVEFLSLDCHRLTELTTRLVATDGVFYCLRCRAPVDIRRRER